MGMVVAVAVVVTCMNVGSFAKGKSSGGGGGFGRSSKASKSMFGGGRRR